MAEGIRLLAARGRSGLENSDGHLRHLFGRRCQRRQTRWVIRTSRLVRPIGAPSRVRHGRNAPRRRGATSQHAGERRPTLAPGLVHTSVGRCSVG